MDVIAVGQGFGKISPLVHVAIHVRLKVTKEVRYDEVQAARNF